MKKLITLLLCCALICSCFSCAETPDKDIVVNKGEGTLEDKIENSTGSGLDVDIDSKGYTETDDAFIFHEIDNFTSSNGVVNYNIDADIKIPKDSEMPVLKVSSMYWKPEILEKFTRLFIGDSAVYEYTDAKSKKDLEKTMLELRQEINDRDAMLEYYEGDEERVKNRVNQLTEKLSAAEAEYETASDTVEKVVSDFKFHDDTYWYSGYGLLSGVEGHITMKATTEADGIPFFIWAQHTESESLNWITCNLWACTDDFPEWDTDRYIYCQTHEFTQEEIESAVAIVENKLSEINALESMADWKINYYKQYSFGNLITTEPTDETYYSLQFSLTPVYNGYDGLSMQIPENCLFSSPENAYSGIYYEEAMRIEVSNNRITKVEYDSPLSIDKVLNESIELESYEESLNRIYTQLEVSITGTKVSIPPYTNYHVVSSNLNISKIELCLVRVPIKDSFTEHYLIPAWCVYGKYEMTTISDGVHNAAGFNVYGDYKPLFIISAVDGSVVSSAI